MLPMHASLRKPVSSASSRSRRDDAGQAAQLMAWAPMPRIAFNRRFGPGMSARRDAVSPKNVVDVRLGLHYRRKGWDP